MEKTISVNNQKIKYSLRKHSRAKRITLKIQSGQLSVTLPKYMPISAATLFVHSNKAWIKQHLQELTTDSKAPIPPQQISLLKIKTRNLVRSRLAFFNQHYKLRYARISVRDQKTRWGSCSANKTLSFNFRLALLPPELADYIVVHELCHLKEMNHSCRFWNLVSQTVPDYPLKRSKLKKYAHSLL